MSGRAAIKGSLRPSGDWLLELIPITVVLDRMAVPAPIVFLVAALAIVSLAALIVRSTEQVAERTGPAVGGLVNATFGSLPELIICVVALRAGLVEMVRASLVGAVLANVLLALGVAFVLGGRRYHVMDYNPAGARTYASMLMLAVLTLAMPAAFHRFLEVPVPASSRAVDLATSLVLLVTYVCYCAKRGKEPAVTENGALCHLRSRRRARPAASLVDPSPGLPSLPGHPPRACA